MLLLAGIDEAGYGPTLGPLAVACTLFRVRQPPHPDTTPNLWQLLESGVSHAPGRGGKPDPRGRIAVADSKALKLANSVTTTHPLVHLERGVLAFHRLLAEDFPPDDASLLAAVDARFPPHPCYSGDPTPLPLAHDPAQLSIAANTLARATQAAGVDLLALRCCLLAESDFNMLVRSTGSKAETTAVALVDHLRAVWSAYEASPPEARLGIACDRQGGRLAYAELLERAFPGAAVTVIEQSDHRSRYTLEHRGRRAGIAFVVEGEIAHLPVALASMLAKYARELAMLRFNRHWTSRAMALRLPGLKPTAGYAQDARRWLHDAATILTPADRDALVRIA